MNTHDKISRLIDDIESIPAMDFAGRAKGFHDLRAAIKADRQQRGGEPVAWRWRIPIVANNGDVLEYSDWVLGNKPNFLSWLPHEELVPPQSAAPVVKESLTVAEPVKVPGDAPAALRFAAQVVELYDDATMVNDYMIDSSDCAGILNALADYFTRYGQPAQPAASDIPVPTTKEEYIALLDLAIELGKKLNIAWEDALRASGQPAAPVAQEPVAYRVLRKTLGGEWKSDGRDWCDGRPSPDLVADIAKRSDGWRIEYAYAAPVSAQVQPVVNQQMTTAASDVLADTQRAIIEAAERRGYARAEAENVGYRTDAGRYRFIRPGDKDVWCSSGDDLLTGDQLDAAIDAARAAKEDHHD